MTASAEWSLPAVLDVVTGVAPDRDMIVWEDRRLTYAQVAQRSKLLAGYLADRGLGVRWERPHLERWECGQSRVATVLSNCPEYLEAVIASFRARCAPYNVNQHYRPGELAALFGRIGVDAIVYHRRFGPLIAAAAGSAEGIALDTVVLIDVDDGSGVPPMDGSVGYEAAVAAGSVNACPPSTSPDDIFLVCTGGTTGMPKGVIWRQADIYVSAMYGSETATAESIAAAAGSGAGTWFAAPPLMHAAAQWTVFSGLVLGGTVVLHDDSGPFDARRLLETAERERVNIMSLVGDAYARPIVEELNRASYDLSSLVRLGIGGAFTSPTLKEELLRKLPQMTIADGYGASETGGMAFGNSRNGKVVSGWVPSSGAAVLSSDRSRFLAAGDPEIGWTARVGRVPLGYLDDPEQTERTFPIIDGRRVAVPGDRARIEVDGTIVMLGRDSLVINTGGEKVFVEEVEEVVRSHPDVVDAVVVGRPSDRFGEEVVAIVALQPGRSLTAVDLREFVAEDIARFKAPRALLVCPEVRRHASGKADYSWARDAAVAAEPV
jgi:3-oxocholest-4-en-26-oate---CoA ligase